MESLSLAQEDELMVAFMLVGRRFLDLLLEAGDLEEVFISEFVLVRDIRWFHGIKSRDFQGNQRYVFEAKKMKTRKHYT